MKVLVVEDSPSMRSFVVNIIESGTGLEIPAGYGNQLGVQIGISGRSLGGGGLSFPAAFLTLPQAIVEPCFDVWRDVVGLVGRRPELLGIPTGGVDRPRLKRGEPLFLGGPVAGDLGLLGQRRRLGRLCRLRRGQAIYARGDALDPAGRQTPS